MVPETRKSEKVVVALLAQKSKEKKNVLEKMESKVVKDAGADLCTTGQDSDVPEKQKVTVLEVENPDINITDGVNPGGGENGDTTEESSGSLSSFDDTFSGGDGALGMSDDEINSELRGGGQPPWAYAGYEDAFGMRKKKLTSHWRNFIRPLMWRCKWAELQMRKFQAQASMYSRLLEEFDRAKQTQKENFDAESQCSRCVPFPHQMKRRKIMRRKKRKRVEDTTDIAAYMLQHNLFAYRENKGTLTDHVNLSNGYGNPVIPAIRSGGINFVDNDALVQFDDEETSLERILAKIYSMQSQVHVLTTRVDNVINENHGRFSSLDKLSLLTTSDSGASTAHDPTTPSSDKDKVLITSPSMTTQPASEHHVEEEELSMPVISVTVDQVADSLPSIRESEDQLVVANKSANAEDETPLKKYPIKEERLVYRRSAKKRKMEPNSSQAQNEKSSVFLASRNASLRNNQKKRGKRKGARSGKKSFP